MKYSRLILICLLLSSSCLAANDNYDWRPNISGDLNAYGKPRPKGGTVVWSPDASGRVVNLAQEVLELHPGFTVYRLTTRQTTYIEIAPPGGGATNGVSVTTGSSYDIERMIKHSFNLRYFPVEKSVSLSELITTGVLKPLDKKHLEQWQKAAELRSPASEFGTYDIQIESNTAYFSLAKPLGDDVFIEKPSTIRSIAIFVPEYMNIEDSPQGATRTYTIADGKCVGRGEYCINMNRLRDRYFATNKCFPKFTKDVDVHAISIYRGSMDNSIPVKFASADKERRPEKNPIPQIDIHIGHTSRPVVVLLESYESSVWAIAGLTDSIAAVLIRSYKGQAIAGIQEHIPVRFSTHLDGMDAGCGGIQADYKPGSDFENWSADAEILFGSPIMSIQGDYIGSRFAIGDVESLSEKPPIAVELDDLFSSGPFSTFCKWYERLWCEPIVFPEKTLH